MKNTCTKGNYFKMRGCCMTIGLIILSIATIKTFVRIITGWDRSSKCLIGKTCLVTGANSGIGFYTAQEFAKRGARVILACKNSENGEKAKAKIIQSTENPNVVIKILNLASLQSVRDFAYDINKSEERLDILVNNAAVAGLEDVKTCDGLNMIMQVNHLSPFLLTNLLMDLLKKSAPSRIVVVTCSIAYMAQVDPNNLNEYPMESKIPKAINYANSKFCNLLFANELARKLKGTQVVVNSTNPGFANTNIYRTMNSFVKPFAQMAAIILFKTSEEGAQTSIYAATSQEVEGVSGEYFDNCRIAWFPPMPKSATNVCLAKKVWDKSEELVQMTTTERHFCRCKSVKQSNNRLRQATTLHPVRL